MLSTSRSTKYLFLATTLMFTLAINSMNAPELTLIEWEIISIQSTQVSIPLILDTSGLIFSATVLFISSNVMWFTTSYMGADQSLSRFTHLVLLFIASMNLLIFIPNLICLLIGWDGLGLVSFILVIYYQNHKSAAAGMITALTNRIGDVMLLISIAWALQTDSWSITHLNSSPVSPLLWTTILLAAMTKSAQMPFSAWLPAAMAAPTPVSALVHSSTLVTAGVFLLYRFNPLLSSFPTYNKCLLIISSCTMLMAGMIAMSEMDMKKIIALSTLSQLGVMMFSLSLNLPDLALFHLLTHALFKATLFVCAGNLIHLFLHSQDLRLIGNTANQLPVTASCMTIANMALCAMPFMAGFYSKDAIIESAFSLPLNLAIFFMLSLATALTVLYTIRLTKFVFLAHPTSAASSLTANSETFMMNPMILLSFGAITSGALMNWAFQPFLFLPTLPTFLKLLAPLLTILALLISSAQSDINTNGPSSFLYKSFSSSMWFLNFLSSQFLMKAPQKLAHSTTKSLDQGWTEVLGPQGINLLLKNASTLYQPIQANTFNTHLVLILMTSSTILLLTSFLHNLYKM